MSEKCILRGKSEFKLQQLSDGKLVWWCPACETYHGGFVDGQNRPVWGFDGNFESPTFTPSFLVKMPRADKVNICHTFVKNGQIQYLNDSTHSMAGKTIPMVNIDEV